MEELEAQGGNTREAEARLGGNVSLYERMLVKFADMMKFLYLMMKKSVIFIDIWAYRMKALWSLKGSVLSGCHYLIIIR